MQVISIWISSCSKDRATSGCASRSGALSAIPHAEECKWRSRKVDDLEGRTTLEKGGATISWSVKARLQNASRSGRNAIKRFSLGPAARQCNRSPRLWTTISLACNSWPPQTGIGSKRAEKATKTRSSMRAIWATLSRSSRVRSKSSSSNRTLVREALNRPRPITTRSTVASTILELVTVRFCERIGAAFWHLRAPARGRRSDAL